jgi:hypothetical protein
VLWGSGFGVEAKEYRVRGLQFGIWSLGLRDFGFETGDCGIRFRMNGVRIDVES